MLGEVGERLPRAATQARRPARRARHLSDRLQTRHGRRRHPGRFHRQRARPSRPTTAPSSNRPPRTTSGTSKARPTNWSPPQPLSWLPSRPATSSAAKGAVPDHPHLLRAHRAGGRVVPGQPRPANRPARGRSRAGRQRWTGFHRLEKDLWVTGPQPDTNALADQLWPTSRELEPEGQVPGVRHRLHPDRGGRRVCSTRSRPARSPARRTSSATPTSGTSRERRGLRTRWLSAADPRRAQRRTGQRVDQRFGGRRDAG